jgi:hypothetical protein
MTDPHPRAGAVAFSPYAAARPAPAPRRRRVVWWQQEQGTTGAPYSPATQGWIIYLEGQF